MSDTPQRPEDHEDGSTVILSERAEMPGIPRVIGDYVVESLIGRGGMGVVYKARHRKLNRRVAIKLLVEGKHARAPMRQRFEREARAMAKLNHPHIVGVHEVGEYQGQPYFVMDYIDGLPLKRFILKLPNVTNVVIADICMRMTDAVQYAHEQGIVHRDLKPDNILMNAQGDPVVTDFGLAKDLNSSTLLSLTGDVMGTPAFMSPEQARGLISDIDAQSDVYSMGAVLYWLLTRQEPFHGKTMVETLSHVAYDEPPTIRKYNPAIESELNAICLKAMEKDKHDRYMTARDMGADLKRFIDGYPVLAKPLTWKRRFHRMVLRHQAALAGATAALVGAALVGTLLAAVFSKSYLERMEPRLASPTPAIRSDALNALGREIVEPENIKPTKIAAAVDRLLQCIDDPDPSVRSALLRYLAAHGNRPRIKQRMTEEQQRQLLEWASNDEQPALRNEALEVVGRIRLPAFADYLLVRLSEPNPALRMRIIRALGDQGTRRAYTPLMQIIIRDPICRAEAEAAIARMYDLAVLSPFADVHGSASAALKDMSSALAQYNRQVEAAMNMGLNSAKDKPTGPYSAYAKALKSDDRTERLKAVYELSRGGNEQAFPVLIPALGHEDPDTGAAAALALARIDAEQAIEEARMLIRKGDSRIRANAARMLGYSGRDEAVDVLLVALAEEQRGAGDVAVMEAMVFALGDLGRAEARPGLEALANSEEPGLRAAVADVLVRLPE